MGCSEHSARRLLFTSKRNEVPDVLHVRKDGKSWLLQVRGPYDMENQPQLGPVSIRGVPAALARAPLTQEKA